MWCSLLTAWIEAEILFFNIPLFSEELNSLDGCKNYQLKEDELVHMACMQEMEYSYKLLSESLKGREYSVALRIDIRIIIRWILKK